MPCAKEDEMSFFLNELDRFANRKNCARMNTYRISPASRQFLYMQGCVCILNHGAFPLPHANMKDAFQVYRLMSLSCNRDKEDDIFSPSCPPCRKKARMNALAILCMFYACQRTLRWSDMVSAAAYRMHASSIARRLLPACLRSIHEISIEVRRSLCYAAVPTSAAPATMPLQ